MELFFDWGLSLRFMSFLDVIFNCVLDEGGDSCGWICEANVAADEE